MHPFCVRRVRFVLLALTATLVALSGTPTLQADHGACPGPNCQLSTGIYRIPYEDGSLVTISNDHHTHNPDNRIDMWVATGTPVVAAASGWIRAIVDFNGNFPGAGDNADINGNPQDDALEHSCQDGTPAVPNSVVVGLCSDYNNYVWIEHANGEWTKYTHFGTGTVSALWSENQWVEAGEVLGLEGDVGRAGGPHLHFEVGLPNDPTDPSPFCDLGGFITGGACGTFGINLVPRTCDIGTTNNLYVVNDAYVAAPCNHQPPTADAGGPYVVDEGSDITFDGSGSNDPDGNPLVYEWSPDDNLDDPSLAQPTFTGVDDLNGFAILRVYDQIESLRDISVTTLTVLNVAPTVSAAGDVISEGAAATVSASVFDPGTLDTHTATISWGDGTAPQPVTVAQLQAGVSHVFGDNGVYGATVSVADDDGGVGVANVMVTVANVNPSATIDEGAAVAFPGGDYLVVDAGSELPVAADAGDVGSDDLTFTWNVGDVNTYYNNGVSPDPAQSPFGTFPFAASDDAVAVFGAPGVEPLTLSVTDDDGGAAAADSSIVVLGTAETTESSGWWKHQYSGAGSPHIDESLAAGYLEIVNAVSSVFSEQVAIASAADAHNVLSPIAGDRRAHARAELLVAWLQFASGAVAWNAQVALADGTSVQFLHLLTHAEVAILNAATTDAELHGIEQQLARVGHP